MSYNITNAIQGGNLALTTAGLTGISGAAATFGTGATALTYVLNGIFGSKAQVSGQTFTPVTGTTFKNLTTNQPLTGGPSATQSYNGSACVFVLLYDGTNFFFAQGPIVAIDGVTAGTTAVTPCPWPSYPDTMVACGYFTVKFYHASTVGTWVPGTGLWNATNVTIGTVNNVMALPTTMPLA